MTITTHVPFFFFLTNQKEKNKKLYFVGQRILGVFAP